MKKKKKVKEQQNVQSFLFSYLSKIMIFSILHLLTSYEYYVI